ncbi:MAG: HU family DNA-binding protein [Candidatus Paceibacteria bacterium]
MTKQDLVDVLASKAGISKSGAGEALNALIDAITGSLKKGQDVVLTGFGTFRVASRKARTGRNPKTGETIKIAARKVVRFKAGAELKNAVK